MLSIRDDFEERIKEADILLKHIEDLSNQTNSVQKSSILKSAYIILLYNIIEATTRLVFERIHDDLSNYSYQQFSEKIQLLFVDYYFKNQSDKKYKSNIDNTFSNALKFPLLEDYTKKVTLFSGNLDARELNKLLKKYGIGALTTRNKHMLLTIKNKRNKLAHGEDMFKDSCRGYTVKELTAFKSAVYNTMKQLINLGDTFLISKIYLVS